MTTKKLSEAKEKKEFIDKDNNNLLLVSLLIIYMPILLFLKNLFEYTFTFSLGVFVFYIIKLHELIQNKLNKEKEQFVKDYNRQKRGSKLSTELYLKIAYYIPIADIKSKILLKSVFYADIPLMGSSIVAWSASYFTIGNNLLILIFGFWIVSFILFIMLLFFTLRWYLFEKIYVTKS